MGSSYPSTLHGFWVWQATASLVRLTDNKDGATHPFNSQYSTMYEHKSKATVGGRNAESPSRMWLGHVKDQWWTRVQRYNNWLSFCICTFCHRCPPYSLFALKSGNYRLLHHPRENTSTKLALLGFMVERWKMYLPWYSDCIGRRSKQCYVFRLDLADMNQAADSSLTSTLVDHVSCLSLCSTDELEVRLLDRLSGHMFNPVCLWSHLPSIQTRWESSHYGHYRCYGIGSTV